MTALVDTSVLIEGIAPEITEPWAVSIITIGELEAGVLLAGDDATRAQRLGLLSAVLAETLVIDVDRIVSARYGELRAAGGRGPTNDLWIAATALAHDYDAHRRWMKPGRSSASPVFPCMTASRPTVGALRRAMRCAERITCGS